MIPKYDKIVYTDNIPYAMLDETWILVESDCEAWQLRLLSGVISVNPMRTDVLTNYIVCRIDNEVYDLMENKDWGYKHPVFLKHAVGGYVAKKEKSNYFWVKTDGSDLISSFKNRRNLFSYIRVIKLDNNSACMFTESGIHIMNVINMEEEKMPPLMDCISARLTIKDEWFLSLEKPVLPVRKIPEIERVIFNYPATIVIWKDNTKTVVRCSENDQYDEETGLALCIAKKALGNKGNWYNEFKKWLPESSNLDSDAILAEITKAARKAKFKKFDYDRINDVVQMIEFNSKNPLRLPVILTQDAAEMVKDVLKQVIASIS